MKRTELLWEEGRIRGRENNSILNEYALINYVLESVYQYSLPVAVPELPVSQVLPALEMIIKKKIFA